LIISQTFHLSVIAIRKNPSPTLTRGRTKMQYTSGTIFILEASFVRLSHT